MKQKDYRFLRIVFFYNILCAYLYVKNFPSSIHIGIITNMLFLVYVYRMRRWT